MRRAWPDPEWEQLDVPRDLAREAAAIQAEATTVGSYALLAVVGGHALLRHGSVGSSVGMQSVRKALMNALIGRAVADGQLSLSSTMDELGIDDVAPALTDQEKRATVRDCLMGRSGVYHTASYEPVGLDSRRPVRGSHAPGEYWFYNNWDFNVLATVLERGAGLDTFRAFAEWFAEPMGMADFDPGACRFLTEEPSIHPAYLFSMSARDLARFGYLYLRRGAWGSEQLLPEDWIAESLHPHSQAAHGYEAYATAFGLLWWVMRPDLLGGRRSYAALGGSGHGVFILPEIDSVIVHRNDEEASTPDWGDILPLLAKTADLCERVASA